MVLAVLAGCHHVVDVIVDTRQVDGESHSLLSPYYSLLQFVQVFKGLAAHHQWDQKVAHVHNQVIVHCDLFPNTPELPALLWKLAAIGRESLKDLFSQPFTRDPVPRACGPL